MRRIFMAASLVAVFSFATIANAQVIFEDDFESYADTAGLGGVWTLGDGTLDTTLGNGGNSLDHPGTLGNNTNSVNFADLLPGIGETLTYSVDIYDDGGDGSTGASENRRLTAGLRGAGSANIIEMGMYNNPAHYAYRTVLFAAGATNWVAFDNLVDDAGDDIINQAFVGWHRFTAEITGGEFNNGVIDFSLDLNTDGNINATASVPISFNAAGWNIIRLGGPSNLSSPQGGANFDNVSLVLTAVPEPSSMLLGLLSLVGLAAAKRRR